MMCSTCTHAEEAHPDGYCRAFVPRLPEDGTMTMCPCMALRTESEAQAMRIIARVDGSGVNVAIIAVDGATNKPVMAMVLPVESAEAFAGDIHAAIAQALLNAEAIRKMNS